MEMSFTDGEGRGGRGGVAFANVTIRRERGRGEKG